MGDISNNFSYSEFIGNVKLNQVPINARMSIEKLVKEVLQPARDILGTSIQITSGWRSEEHNRLIGGAKDSQHIKGTACDLIIPRMTGIQSFEFFAKHFGNKIGGLGLYADERTTGKFVHVDIRPRTQDAITTWYRNRYNKYTALPNYAKDILVKNGVKYI
jgi:uncharacterized protein YcbK (DUF882 family)